MAEPVVAVILPVFNGARFITEALSAVLAQDHRPLEVVVVDDGSDDGSADIAETFSGVRVLRRPNQGPAAARNAGIAASSAPLITFCDADDRYRPHKVGAQADYLCAHPEVGCVLVHHEVFIDPEVTRPAWLFDDDGVQPESAMTRRSVVDSCGAFDPQLRFGEGMEWLVRLRTNGVTIGVLPDVLVDRRIHGSNLSYDRRALQRTMLGAVRARIHQEKQ